ncbi:MAG: hypothetical protein RRX93_08465, partial [Bacteroidales bacterium]
NGGLVDLWVLADFSKEFAPYFPPVSNATQANMKILSNSFSFKLIKENGATETNPTSVAMLGSNNCPQGDQPSFGMDGCASPMFSSGPCPYYGYTISVSGAGLFNATNIINNADGSFTVKVHKVAFKLLNTNGFYTIPFQGTGEDQGIGASNWNIVNSQSDPYVWVGYNAGDIDWARVEGQEFSYAKGGVVLKKAIEGTMRFGKTCPGSDATTTANLNYPTVSGGPFPYNYVLQSYSSGTWNKVTTAALNIASFNNITGTATMNLSIPAATAQTLKDIPLRLRLSNPANPADTANLSDTLRFYTIPTRLYINPAPQGGWNYAGYARFPYVSGGTKPIDTIKEIVESTVFYALASCTKVSASVPNNTCYNSGGDFVYTNNQYSLYTSNSLTSTFGVKANANVGIPNVSANAGVNKAYYYIKVTNSTGCIVNTDTVLVIPKINYVAPVININSAACGGGTFSMDATAPTGLAPTDWQWVIRQEQCTGAPALGTACDLTAKQQPDSYKPANFGGGIIYNSGTTKTHKAYAAYEYSTKVLPALGTASNKSSFVLTQISTNPGENILQVGYPIFPAPEAPLTGTGNCSADAEAIKMGWLKYVYVRYKAPGTNEWSQWGVAITAPSATVGPALTSNFSITANKTSIGNKVSGTPGSADTAVNIGSPVTFTLVDWTGGANLASLYLDMVFLKWQYSTDNGTTWNTWATTNGNIAATKRSFGSYGGPYNTFTSPLRNMNQEELHRVIVSYNACDTMSHYDREKETTLVSLKSNLIPGDIVGKIDGNSVATNAIMCLGSTLNLTLNNADPLAVTYRWDVSTDNATWKSVGNNTSSLSYTPTDAEISGVSALEKYYRVKIFTANNRDSASSASFHVSSYKVEKVGITMLPNTAAKAGVCAGTKLEIKANAISWTMEGFDIQKSTNGGSSFSLFGTSSTDYSGNASSADNGAIFRIKTWNKTCIAYSESITLRVHSLAKGSISPSILCKDQ